MSTESVSLPEHVVKTVDEEARRAGTTPEQLIASCVEEHLRGETNLPSRVNGRPAVDAAEQGLFTFSFVRRLSHEVRTAVTSILGFTEILETDVAVSQQELVSIIQRGGERLLRTIDAVVYLARLENGSLELDPEPLDAGLHVQALTEPYRERAEEKGVALTTKAPSSDMYLTIDPDVLARIVRALVDNAVKFTEEGEVSVRIVRENGRPTLTVRDTGCGIAQEAAAAMFDPFSQRGARGREQVEGNGLGLTVTRKLVDFLGGTIEWESRAGEGTVFTVCLPADLLRSSAAEKSEKRSHSWGFDQLPPDQRVLLIEDDPAICQLVPVMLPESYTFDVLTDVASVLERAQIRRYDIVLMDINLGDRLDGVELMREMREIEGYSDVLFIAMTAYPEVHEGETFHEKGFDGYVGKPFSKRVLYENLIQV